MQTKLGFIGCGNMSQAMMGGIIKSKIFPSENIIVADICEESLAKAKEKLNVNITTKNTEVARDADILILAVKPNIYPIVIEEVKDVVKSDVIIITIAAGIEISKTEEMFGRKLKIVRVMPNTPALVGEGMAAICPNKLVAEEELRKIVNIFESFGEAEVVDESLMDVVTSISGSSPAYVYMFIEALADGAVLDGMPRDKAYKFAAQAVLGSAKMVLQTGKHPGLLKDMVCSPGGTTIAAVAKLEEKGFRDSVISTVRTCTEKSIEMSK